MTKDLAPCPFCGGKAEIRYDSGKFCVVCVGAFTCFCAMGEGYDRDAMPDHAFISKEVAINAWNTRASTPTPDLGVALQALKLADAHIGWGDCTLENVHKVVRETLKSLGGE